MIYTPEILTGIDVNINRLQTKLNNNLQWGANVHIFGRIRENKRNNSTIFEAYTGGGEYSEIFIDDKKASTIAFLVDKKRELPSNEVIVTIIVSVYLPDAYNDSLQHDEHAIVDVVRILRNSGLINVSEVNTDFYQIFSAFDIKRIEYRNMYPFVNFSVTGKMRFVEKCLT
jgi:hypothetical protein